MTFLEEAIIGGFIGEAASRCVDVSWTKIKEAVKNRKNKHQNIESQIYNVVVNVLNQITYNEFENDQDKIYQAAEKLLMGYKDGKCDSIEVVRFGLQILDESVNSDKYMEFRTLLYQELCKKDYEELYRQIRLLQQDKESSKTSRIEQKVDIVQQGVDETNRRLSAIQENNRGKDNIQNKEPVKSRTQEYADKWNQNMFLNDFDKRDENAGVNVKLSEVYLEKHLPHYIWENNINPSNDLKELLSEYIYEKKESQMLLILGQPGIGKSTLITWITANFTDRVDDILVYKFASDLGNTDWKNGRISNRVLEKLGLNHSDLNGKILILDGFDEVSIESNRRTNILDSLYGDWIYNKTIDNFSLFITCRENYVQRIAILKCKYITLQPWDVVQIRSFCNIFQEKTKNNISESTIEKLLGNKEILGIPLILYMVLALNISINKEGSIVDVYDKIFSLEGGIYDRCIDNRSFADKHRISAIKKQIHQVSKDIAIWMFENNPVDVFIPKEEYQNIYVDVMYKLQQDFLIGNYYKLIKHCDGIGTEELYFVHRSIYEYFVAETIYSAMDEAIGISKEELACVVGRLLKRGKLSKNILTYLKQKIEKSKLKWMFDIVNKTFQLMLRDGMTYYAGECYKNVIDCEMSVFANMLEILHLWGNDILKLDNTVVDYIQYNKKIELNLDGVIFEKMYLNSADLCEVNLTDADSRRESLIGVDLRGAYLRGAHLDGTNLCRTHLIGADLIGAHLKKADLSGANLTNASLIGASLEGAILEGTILKGANLSKVNLRAAYFGKVNLLGANLSYSMWDEEDIQDVLSQLKDADFERLVIYKRGKGIENGKEVSREKLFSTKENEPYPTIY